MGYILLILATITDPTDRIVTQQRKRQANNEYPLVLPEEA
jgi:hypothetical protein